MKVVKISIKDFDGDIYDHIVEDPDMDIILGSGIKWNFDIGYTFLEVWSGKQEKLVKHWLEQHDYNYYSYEGES